MDFDLNNHSHRRFNPLTLSWVLCSPHRAKRPWQGQMENVVEDKRPEYDPKCYLCPGNKRIGGHDNPKYKSTFVFPNDFPAVQAELPQSIEETQKKHDDSKLDSLLLQANSIRGECHVICFSPRHDLTIAAMSVDEIEPIVEEWSNIFKRFITVPYVEYVQIFENKGEAMGCSNPHPHGQVWCTETIPEEPSKELVGLEKYHREHGSCLLCDYAKLETERRDRVVCENEHFICVVPWWAVWPFETLVLPREHLRNLLDCTPAHRRSLADILRRIACKYDNLFQCSFPYSMGLHQSPCVDASNEKLKSAVELSHFHIHFYPPLLRSATVKKFLVGFEMLGMPQRDLTSEQAAERLRVLSEEHYRQRK